MHLAIVSPYPPAITGIGQYGYHVSCLLAGSGVFSKISVLYGQTESQEKVNVSAKLELLPGWRLGQWDAGWRIATHLRQMKPDVVWFNLGTSAFGKSPLANLSGFFGPAGAHLLDLPSVVTLHELPELADLRALKAPGGVFSLYGARLLARLAIRADVVCLTMQRYADWLSASQPGPRYLHIPTGAYYPPEMLPEPAAPELLFFSTLAPFKGLETLLKAFQILQVTYPALRLTIAGASHIRFPDYPMRLKARFGHLAGVRWLDQVPETKVRSLFERASLVVLPYQASTGASSVLMQTAAWGRAVVASDLDEIRGVARENGLEATIFERGNVPALVESLKRQLGSTTLRQAQVRQNFAAIQQHRPERLCAAYLQALDLALEAHCSPAKDTGPDPIHYGACLMPRRIKLAMLLAFGLHGILVVTAQYRLSYDAYNHMFFADHYLRDWWTLWEPRWYTGFEIISYPPLVHRLIALLGRLMGVDAAFGLLLWLVVTAYPLAIYHFSRIFTCLV